MLKRNSSEIVTRRTPASVKPKSFNAETRTFEAVISTGAGVRRHDMRGPYIERLDLSAINPRALVGVAVLVEHRHGDFNAHVGTVTAARTEPGQLVASIKITSDPSADPVVRKLEEGVLNALSIGYRVNQWAEKTDGGQRTRTAVDWSVEEVSLVAVPADRGAQVRADMPELNPATTPPNQPSPTVDRTATDIAIRDIAELAGLDTAWATAQIERGASAEEVRAAALTEIRERNTRTRSITSHGSHNDRTLDNPEVRARSMGEAIFARITPGHSLSDPARAFAGLSIPELARESLRAASIPVTGLTAAQVVVRALHTTSDFALALGDAVGRTMRQSYEAAPSGLKAVARKSTLPDFRERSRLQTSQFDKLEKVNEHGEFKRGSFKENAESYKLDTFGKVFGISRQALVNDDLGIFNDVPRKLGIAAAAFEAQSLVDLLITGSGLGPNMSDGKRLFHADHGNLASGGGNVGAPDEALLSKARLAMRKQKDSSGQLIAVVPKFIVIPPDLETTVEKLLSTVQATQTADVNAFAGKLTPVVEPRLANTAAWYIVADPVSIDGLEYAHLEGEPGPQIETRTGFDVDGVETRVRLDFGAGFIDHRGWYRNPGA